MGTGRPPRPAVLLLGHGSHVDGRSSDSVHRLAEMLRASGRYPEVRVAFWKEEPQLRHAFLLVESSRVVAVPFFTSEGYFTDGVLPRELGIEPPLSEVQRVARPGAERGPAEEGSSRGHSEHRRVGPGESPARDSVLVHYTRAVGAHPAMGDAVVERALERLADDELLGPGGKPASDVTLVILGHGTERHPESGAIVEEITARLARESPFRRVTCCFLDQDPRMLAVLESLDAPRAVLVPFFMAEGWHVGRTIPRDLDLEGGRSRVGATEVHFTDPVGTHPAVVRVVEQMVAEAVGETVERAGESSTEGARDGAPGPGKGKETKERAETEGGTLPARARKAFTDWIHRGGKAGRVFLQTRVSPWRGESGSKASGAGPRYEIRHVDDTEVAPESLERSRDPARARTLADRTETGEHRPLTTAPNLRRGWVLEGLDARQMWEAYAHLYPVAPVHWYLGRRGELPVISFRETASRQTGIYEIVAELDDRQVRKTRREVCEGGCLRRVRWSIGEGRGTPAPDSRAAGRREPGSSGEVPCPEPCSLFVTRAREAATG